MNRVLPAVLVAAAIVIAGYFLSREVQAQALSPVVKWQYGLLIFSGGEPTFTVARQSSTIQPPSGKPGGGGYPPAVLGTDVHFATRDAWSTEMMTLDALGDQGWDAYAAYGDGARTTILLKRKAP